MKNVVERARWLRKQIEHGSTIIPDDDAAQFTELFPAWSGDGFSYVAGDRVRYNGELYKCLQAHNSQPDWDPVSAVSLWAKVLAGQGGTAPDEWEKPDSTNPYMTGDRVFYNGAVYESVIDGNLWSPEEYPAGWKLIE